MSLLMRYIWFLTFGSKIAGVCSAIFIIIHVRCIFSSAWHPAALPQLATLDEAELCVWKVRESSVEVSL